MFPRPTGARGVMTERRDSPYVWVTWVTKLLADDAHCEWAAWFRSHHARYDKRPSDFDHAAWNAAHAELVRTRAEALRQAGYTVSLGEQNRFTLRGNSGAMLGGKPDILAVRGAEALVVDCKTGQQRDSDYFQVLIYMLALPYVNTQCRGKAIAGEVQYTDRTVAIAQHGLTAEMKKPVWSLLERVAGEAPLLRVPSSVECSFCDITSADCPERVDAAPSDDQVEAAPF